MTIFALGLPVLAMGTVAAFEFAEVASARTQLQSIADSAALNGAHELGIDRSDATTSRTKLMADQFARPLRARWTITSEAATDANFSKITVKLHATRPSLFADMLPPGGFKVNVSATAMNASSVPLCVLATAEDGSDIINLKGSSAIAASQCLVQSDSDLIAEGSASVQASAVRTVLGASGSITPQALTDAPKIRDPFASLPINVPSACSDVMIQLLGGTRTLNPGVHCGLIRLAGNGTLKLNPGEHYFKGGGLSLAGNVKLVGSDVVLIFDNGAGASFVGNTTLDLEGRKSGPYAGFVLVAARNYTGTFGISTRNAKKLLGTIYIPNGTLAVSGKGNKVADQSAWTVVVAKAISVQGSAKVVINSNYNAATVPVPTGVGPGAIRLTN